MNKELPKSYDPKQYENTMYKRWEESGFFNPDNLNGEPYAIMMPPPNVTGVLHLGHALENSLMDTMARYQRMQGKKVLLLPGTDHAAVATQARVEKNLIATGVDNPRDHFGREGLLEKIRDYAEASKATILSQIKKMGTSADWSRLAYTFDEKRNRAVNTVFKHMYDDGLIYRGTRLVNWSVGAQSVLSDDELEWEDRKEPFYYIRCGRFVIGTVRPETKCADSPLVVHPTGEYVALAFTNGEGEEDMLIVSKNLFDYREEFTRIFNEISTRSDFTVLETYTGKQLEGQAFDYDTYAGMRHFTVLADEVIDMEKGTGAMTISSNHSADDYDLAQRRGLKETFIEKIDLAGKMTGIAGVLTGEDREVARKKAAQIMKEKGLIVGIDYEYTHRVPLCYRTQSVVEPMVSQQWFINVNKEIPGRKKTLRELMKDALTVGLDNDPEKKVVITPERFTKLYLDRVDTLRDWCLSRQIWWGHRIPVWYCDNPGCDRHEKEPVAVGEPVSQCPHCGLKDFRQDPDTLDTWFSSGMWTFATLGWPEDTADMKAFHPTSWMQMGYEILYLWLMRMVLFSAYNFNSIPFKDAYIHGILRDKDGQKFSKSLGNGIDPLDVIEQSGTDALRWSLLAGIAPGNDSKFYLEKVEGAQHLVNKLWNISRFILIQTTDYRLRTTDENHSSSTVDRCPQPKTDADQWILAELDILIHAVTNDMETFAFSAAGERLREFTWGKLADWYLEIAKIESSFAKASADKGNTSEILMYILNTLLKLWHPFMPFVTEAIWQEMYGKESMLMVEKWPQIKMTTITKNWEESFGLVMDVVSGIRMLRAEYHIPPSTKITVWLQSAERGDLLEQNADVIRALGNIESLLVGASFEIPNQTASTVLFGAEISLDLAGAIDLGVERTRLQKELEKVAPYVDSLEKKLAGDFATSAPAQIVDKERKKLADAKEKLEKITDQLHQLKEKKTE